MREWKESSAVSPHTAWPAKQALAGAVHRGDAADPKLLQLFVPPPDVKGGPEKLPAASATRAEKSNITESATLDLWR
jgi:hypothetical protein